MQLQLCLEVAQHRETEQTPRQTGGWLGREMDTQQGRLIIQWLADEQAQRDRQFVRRMNRPTRDSGLETVGNVVSFPRAKFRHR